MKFKSRAAQLEPLLKAYKQQEPLVKFLQQKFKQDKRLGSRDRREISNLAFDWFRAANAFKESKQSFLQRLAAAHYLAEQPNPDWLNEIKTEAYIPAEWIINPLPSIKERKQLFLQLYGLEPFPLVEHIGNLPIPKIDWLLQLYKQPLFWFRSRKNRLQKFILLLQENAIQAQQVGNSFGLQRGLNLEQICGGSVSFYGEVQDLNSTTSVLKYGFQPNEVVWDACAASGGKALALMDANPDLNLLVSDLRASILNNLKQRFKEAQLPAPGLLQLDLEQPYQVKDTLRFEKKDSYYLLKPASLDTLLLDLPCSGSGTWSRSPEQMYQFNASRLNDYTNMQKRIISNTIPYIKPKGRLILVTCSVYADENEQHLEWLQQNGFEVLQSGYINQEGEKADTLFSAELRKVV